VAQIVMWGLFIGPWLLFFFFDSNRIKRYVPAGLFGIVMLTIVFEMAKRYDWWEVKQTLFFLEDMTPFVFGVFFVGTILIFYFTYPGFWAFFILNAVFDLFQAYIMSPFFQRLGIYEMRSINAFQLFLIMTAVAILLYLYQRWQDSSFKIEIK